MNYYNEFDPKAAAWLRELIKQGYLPDGVVDERSIKEVKAHELESFDQCHFFAGIGGWPLALQIAGVPATTKLWTGSCPCQPFSVAGKGKGVEDERHLWPVWAKLVEQCRPAIIFGEQVASAAGREWLAGVFADLEAVGYSRAGADLCAASVGAPHIRQRLYWFGCREGGGLADAESRGQRIDGSTPGSPRYFDECIKTSWLADASSISAGVRRIERAEAESRSAHRNNDDGCAGRLGNPKQQGLEGHAGDGDNGNESRRLDSIEGGSASETGCTGSMANTSGELEQCRQLKQERRSQGRDADRRAGAWDNYRIISCADGKARRIESLLAPLVVGLPRGVVPSGDISAQEAAQTGEARITRLRGYGNAILPQLAAEFIQSALEVTQIYR